MRQYIYILHSTFLKVFLAGLAVAFLVFCAAGPSLAGNIVAESIITAASIPNPAWAPENVSDGDTGPTKGWLGDWDVKNPDLWIQFTFHSANKVSAVRVMQAGLPEAGWGRFSRPKKIRVLFFNDAGSTEKMIELKDKEHIFQDLEIAPAEANVIRIEVLDVYPGSRISEMAGFQEIEITAEGTGTAKRTRDGNKYFPGASEVGNMSDTEIANAVREVLSQKPAPEEKKAPDGGAAAKEVKGAEIKDAKDDSEKKVGGGAKPGITDEEREILLLLGELMKRLEKRFEGD